MTWPTNKGNQNVTSLSIFAFILTIISFCAVVAIADFVTPYVSYYYSSGSFPDSEASTAITDNLKSDAWGMVLSSVAGLVLMVLTIMVFKFGGFVSVFFTLTEFIAAYLALDLLVIWIMWKYNPTSNNTLLTMLPYFMMQICAAFVLEVGAIFGQGGSAAKPFVALGCLLGAFVGIIRSTEQSYFYTNQDGSWVDDGTNLGISFGNSILDTMFFFSACAVMACSIARSKMGGTVLWHVIGVVISVGMACVFSLYSTISDYVPVISSEAARYSIASVVIVLTLLTAFAMYRPIHKNSKQSPRTRAADVPALVNGQRPRGPIAANAVVMV